MKYLVTYQQSGVHADEPYCLTNYVRKTLNTILRMKYRDQRVIFYRSYKELLLPVSHFYWDGLRWRPLKRLATAYHKISEIYAKEHNNVEANASRIKMLNIEFERKKLISNKLLTKEEIT